MNILDTIARINEVTERFQVLVDDEQRLIGVVTDGDIRRGLLKRIGMEESVHKIARLEPITYSALDVDGAYGFVRRENSTIRFLPLIRDDRKLEALLIRPQETPSVQIATIMAGGFGTRLGSVTRHKPKPLVEVAGKPILGHILDRLEADGIKKVFLCLHHMSEAIVEFVEGRANIAEIEPVLEETKLGTAGPLRTPANLMKAGSGPMLVLNGDVITNVDIKQIGNFHEEYVNDITIGAAIHQFNIPYGVIRHSDDGRFLGIDEKPTVQNFIAAGVYLFNHRVLELVPPAQPMDMPELLNLAREAGFRTGLFPIHEFWADVGKPDDLKAVNDRPDLWNSR
jgi:dTDP-glucose pyrophosphorylase